MGYEYYDTPEGEDPFKKLLCTSKYAAAFGITVSTFDVLMYSHPKGYLNTLGRYAYITGPMVGMAAAFTATTYIATNVRKQDDKFNYLLGGIAASGVLGAWQRSPIAAFWGSIFFGIAAVVKKSSIQDGWEFFPEAKLPATGALWTYKNDWTITKDRPGNWRTEP